MRIFFLNLAGEATLVFSIKTEIIGMYADSKINFTLASKLNRATGVTMNGREHIYWSDIEEDRETIVRSIPGNSHEVIVTTGIVLMVLINIITVFAKHSEIIF